MPYDVRMAKRKLFIVNETEFESADVRAIVRAVIKQCGYEDHTFSLCLVHDKRARSRVRWLPERSDRYRIALPRKCAPWLLAAELDWYFRKWAGDKPERYLRTEMYKNKSLELRTKSKPKRTLVDVVNAREQKAIDHVARLQKEIESLEKSLKRKNKLLKDWRKKVAYYAKRQSKSQQEADFMDRLKAKVKSLDKNTPENDNGSGE